MPEMITTDVLPSAQFKILTGTLKAYAGNDGRKRLSGVASSTVRDLHGDTMSQTAILDMERAANDNLTIFLNHSYDVPEDVFGSVEKATAIQRGMDGDGNPNWDLIMDILVDDDNPRADKTYTAIGKGTKLGLSIGAMIPEGGAVRDKDTGALTINHVHLLETSVVSIPANPRSWISNAVKALNKATIEVRSEDDGEACNSCGGGKRKPKDGCTSPFHKEAVEETAPTIEVAATIEVADESVSSQELSESEPEPEVVTEASVADVSTEVEVTADLSEAFDPAISAAVAGVSAALEVTTAKLASMLDELDEEKRARKAAEAQRDEAVLAAHTVLAEVRSIMERVGKTPVGKKTGFVQASADFSHLEQVYSAPFLKLLKQGDTR